MVGGWRTRLHHAAGRFVLFSDILNDRILRYDEVSNVLMSSSRQPALRTVVRSTGKADSSPVSTASAG